MRKGPLKFKHLPHKHQRKEFFAYRNVRYRARIWACRSGKSKITIDECAFQYHMESITGVLIFAPNIAHQNWILKEFPEHCAVEFQGLAWSSAKAKSANKTFMAEFERVCRGRDSLKVLAINSEALPTDTTKKFIKTFLKHHKGKVFFIVDEFHDYGTPGSKRVGVAKAVRDQTLFRRILSATPIDNSPMAAYSEYNLLEENALGCQNHEEFKAYFGVWKSTKTKNGRPYVKFLGPQREEELTERMARYTSIVSREDAGLMAPIDVQKHFELTDTQKKFYKGLKDNPVLGGKVLDGGPLMIKLQQITSGFIVDHESKLHEIVKPEDNPRFQLVINETIHNAPGKVVIWCRFRYDIITLSKLFADLNVPMVQMFGDVKPKDKFNNLIQLEEDPNIKGLIGQWQSGVGTDMRKADTIISASHTFNAIHRHQAADRASAIGKAPVDLIDIVAHNTNDNYILEALADKENVADRISTIGIKELLQKLGNG